MIKSHRAANEIGSDSFSGSTIAFAEVFASSTAAAAIELGEVRAEVGLGSPPTMSESLEIFVTP